MAQLPKPKSPKTAAASEAAFECVIDAPKPNEDEVLLRMLRTPPKPHKPPAPAKKAKPRLTKKP